MKMKMMILSLVLLLGACGTNKTLEGTSWELVSLYGEPLDRATLEDISSFTLSFVKDGDDTRAFGMGDMNRFVGEVEFEKKNIIEFDDMAITKMMGRNQAKEDMYMAMMREALNYKLENGKLIITNGKDVIAEFEVAE